MKKCCGNCSHGEDGVCGFAGEISTDFVCEHFKEQLCDMGGDVEHCEDCAYYPDYKFDKVTGECMSKEDREAQEYKDFKRCSD